MNSLAGIHIENISKNLCTIDYSLPFRGSNRVPMTLRKYINRYVANGIIESIDRSIDITWSFDPSSFQYLEAFDARFNIFHPVDIHKSKFEITTAKYANIILGASDKILERYISVNKPKFKINHGLADHFLLSNKKNNSFIKQPNRINVGYVGNLHYKYLDTTVLIEIITSNSNVDFYFIGPYEESNIGSELTNSNFVESLKVMKNVYLLGSVASEDLPGYLKNFDLFMMCYSGDQNIAEMANPHKILEFLSTGKVVVSHYIDEYRNQENIICMARKNSDLPKTFTNVLNNLDYYNNKSISQDRVSLARNNSYDIQLNRIQSIIAKYL